MIYLTFAQRQAALNIIRKALKYYTAKLGKE